MICPKCKFGQDDQHTECPRCGIVFAKYRQLHDAGPCAQRVMQEGEGDEGGLFSFLDRLLFCVEPGVNPLFFWGRVVVFLIILIWGWRFMLAPLESNYAGRSFMHLVNLPFHEAGHILFRPFGAVIRSLGGSLAQLLMPLICLLTLLIKTRDPFGAAVCLWWFSENFMDIAPYINDARSLTMPLLGGNTGLTSPYGFHDWEFILTELGLLKYDRILAQVINNTGIFLMLAALAWAGCLLFIQYRHLDRM